VDEIAAMRRALELAASPDAPSGPNPRVGAVVLDRSGRVVAEGYHRGTGSAHAEATALAAAGTGARGATVVVTLEPCAHQGRTGPCADALIDAGVGRVVYGQPDVTRLAGGGADRLRASGISVEGGVLEGEARAVNPVWTFSADHHRPYVTWKFAATLDGRVAAEDGTSRWITSAESRADVHRLRARCDALLVGTGTVDVDNPRLTVRLPDVVSAPLRVVMGLRDSRPDRRVDDSAAPTLYIRSHDPKDVIEALTERGCSHLLVEGGPTVAAAFVRASLVDEVVAYVAPSLLGAGPGVLAPFGATTVDARLPLHFVGIDAIGSDVRITADVLRPEGA
jgi:diaminohydroxyphosphoribosylaminopyrimidine deaminase/5-amino-6-(5-phosphoribosylamino)uracil reductase